MICAEKWTQHQRCRGRHLQRAWRRDGAHEEDTESDETNPSQGGSPMAAGPTKRCPSCGFLCPAKALRCRGCDRWFPGCRPRQHPRMRVELLAPLLILGACIIGVAI